MRRASEPEVAGRTRDSLLVHTREPMWRSLASHPKVVSIVRQLIGGAPRVVQTMYLDKPAGASGHSLHQDAHYIETDPAFALLACWIALSDTDADNGGLCIVPGSHRGGLRCERAARDSVEFVRFDVEPPMRDRTGREWVQRYTNVEIDDLDPRSIEKLTLPKGAAVFFTGLTIHGSYANRSATGRPRRAFATHYVKDGTWVLRQDIQKHDVFVTGCNPMPKKIVIVAPREIALREFDLPPRVGDDEVLTETLFSGISAGTEMCYYRGSGPELSGLWDWNTRTYDPAGKPSFSYPLSYGYENVGRVKEIGAGVRDLQIGDVVFSYAGHETHVVQKASAIWKLPSSVSPRAGNLLAILRLCFNGVLAAEPRLGETVLVFGLGALGQLTAQLCRLAGARVIAVDLIESRLSLASRLGAHHVLNARETTNLPTRIRELTDGRGADVAIELTANERGLESAVKCVAPHSKIIAMSFYQGTSPLRLGPEFHYNCVRIQVSQAMQVPVELRHRWDADRICRATSSLLPQLQLDALVTHEFPLDEATDAYRVVDERSAEAIQVVIRYPAANH